MKSMLLTLTLFILTFTLVTSADEADSVQNLFGDLYQGKIYSGYLNTEDPKRKLHYLFAPSQNNPSTDPVVLWLNGGPGCSSMLGFIQEHGPVVIPDYEKGFSVNEYSWNKAANMLYLESPAGVGFSYDDNAEEDLHYDDDKSGRDNRKAILNFFEKFPEYKANEFYIAGESYAGVYVPTLASLLLKEPSVSLKGILVGNGLTDYEVDVENALIDFAWDHALYSYETRDKIVKYCYRNNTNGGFPEANVTHECNEARSEIQEALQGLNIYDIYRICPPQPSSQLFGQVRAPLSYQNAMINTLRKAAKVHRMNKVENHLFGDMHKKSSKNKVNQELEEPVGIWPEGCLDDPFPTEFLNSTAVKTLLHVRVNISYEQCNGYINENYNQTRASLYLYPELISSGIKIQFYSGDTDGAVAFTGTVKWIPKLNLEILEPYRSWIVDKQVAGYVQKYKGLTYVTIKGTGHMAPQWKRAESFLMFKNYLQNIPLPPN